MYSSYISRDFIISLTALLLVQFYLLPAFALSDRDDSKDSTSPVYRRESAHPGSDFVHKYLKPGTYMHESEIRPGMKGYGLSVFHGTAVQRFDVQVIGVMKRVINGKDAILVRLSGDLLGNNKVVRGMSGSPIYIDDKLIGALSYGFDFSTEPIVGVTPIVDMLDALEPAKSNVLPLKKSSLDSGDGKGAPGHLGSPAHLNFTGGGSPLMVPLMSPVALSGYSPRARKFLEKRLGRLGLLMGGEGAVGGMNPSLSARRNGEKATLEPGSSIGVMLSTGDFASVATGTVTSVFGERVLAFGHPFVQAGSVDFPMCEAFVHEILPSLAISFKLASPTGIIGSIYSDRPWSVGGRLGASSRMIPINVTVRDSERLIEKSFSCAVIEHPELSSELISATVLSAIDATYQSAAPYVAKVQTELGVISEGKPETKISRVDLLASGASSSSFMRMLFGDPVSGSVGNMLDKIISNKFEKVTIGSVNLDVTLEPGKNTTEIISVTTDKSVVRPGETVVVRSELKPFEGKPYFLEQVLEIPRTAPDGELAIGVAGGAKLDALRTRMGLKDPAIENLEQLFHRLKQKPRGDVLNTVLALPGQTVHLNGHYLDSPPGHWTKLLFSDRCTKNPELLDRELRVSRELGTLLTGSHIIAVKVASEKKYLARQDWYRAEPNSSTVSSGTTSAIQITRQAQQLLDSSKKSVKPSDGTTSDSASTEKREDPPVPWGKLSSEIHSRLPLEWAQFDEAAHRESERDGVAVDSWGRLFPAFSLSDSKEWPLAINGWAAVLSRGAIYASVGEKLLRWNIGSGTAEILLTVPGAFCSALAADSAGRIFVAVCPGRKIYLLEPGAKVLKDFAVLPPSGVDAGALDDRLGEKPREIITCLAMKPDGTLLAGTACHGRVYGIDSKGTVKELCDTGQAHVISLTHSPHDSRIYIGTAESGTVQSLGVNGDMRAEYQSTEHIVTGAVRTAKGRLYVSTAGKGQLLWIKPGGETTSIATSEAFYTLAYDPYSDTVFAGDAEGDLTQIQHEPLTDQAFLVPVKSTEQEAVVSILLDGSGGLVAMTSNLVRLLKFDILPRFPVTYTSSVKDAIRKSSWSRLRLYGAYNQEDLSLESRISVETRSGDTARPDSTWSTWSRASRSRADAAGEKSNPSYGASDGFRLASPDGRYLQYRLIWTGPPAKQNNDTKTFPCGRESVVGKVSLTYLPVNQRPTYTSVSLKSGDYLSGKETLEVVATDPDGDNLMLDIESSSDQGKSWNFLSKNIRGSKSDTETKSEGESSGKDESDRSKAKTDAESSDKKSAEDDKMKKDKDSPKTEKPEAKAKKSSKTEKLSPEKLSYEWDTSKIPDGGYLLRFTISDRPSNASNWSETRFFRTVIVDNTKPEIKELDLRKSGTGKGFVLSAKALDTTSPVSNAVYRIDDQEQFAMSFDDDLLDSRNVRLKVDALALPPGARKLTVQVSDLAGNLAERTISIDKTIPESRK